MDEDPASTADLQEAWREAMRAAELAERLAGLAEAKAEDAADSAADHSASIAKARGDGLSHMQDLERGTRQVETTAKDEYHRAEEEARDRDDPK